jgi:hypothetical protein
MHKESEGFVSSGPQAGRVAWKCGDLGTVSSNFAKASAEKLAHVTLRKKISKLRPLGERNPQQGNKFLGLGGA